MGFVCSKKLYQVASVMFLTELCSEAGVVVLVFGGFVPHTK